MKKMISRRSFLQATASLAAVSALAACGDTAESTTGADSASTGADVADPTAIKADITFLTNRTDFDLDGTFETMIAEFNKTYPDIKVTVESIADYTAELQIRMQTSAYGDVCMIIDSLPAGELGTYFEPLGTLDELDDTYERALLGKKVFEGTVYGVPNMGSVSGVVYNKRIFAEAGIEKIPTTPDEFLEAMQMVKDNTDAIPVYTNAAAGWPLGSWQDQFPVVKGEGSYQFTGLPRDKGAFAPDGPMYEMGKLFYDIVSNGLCEEDPTTTDWEASKGMLNRGEIACMFLGGWAQIQMKEADEFPDDVSLMPHPFTVDGVQYVQFNADYCYGVNINGKHKEASSIFAHWMSAESGFSDLCGLISPVVGAELPEGFENYVDVEFMEIPEASAEDLLLYDQVQYDSGMVVMDSGKRFLEIIDIVKGARSETFDEYMAELNDTWAAATVE